MKVIQIPGTLHHGPHSDPQSGLTVQQGMKNAIRGILPVLHAAMQSGPPYLEEPMEARSMQVHTWAWLVSSLGTQAGSTSNHYYPVRQN